MAIASNEVGLFVPTNYIWDVAQLQSIDVNSPEFKELLVRLYQNINNIAIALNIKDSGYYDTTQFVNGQLFFPNPMYNSQTSPAVTADFRQVSRLVVNFGALPNAGTKSVPHNLGLAVNSMTSWTRIYGAATDPVGLTGIPLPYASPTLINNIQLSVNATNVVITTGANVSNYTTSYVILEWLST